MKTPPSNAFGDERLGIDQSEAARISGLSAKTLDRLADRGEPVGRLKIGRRVLYHVPTLSGWLAARASAGRADGQGGGR